MEFKVLTNEEEYVVYKVEPDHKEMGQALKAQYNKAFKEKLTKLSRE